MTQWVNEYPRLFYIFLQCPCLHILARETKEKKTVGFSAALSVLQTLGPVKEVLIMGCSAHLASRDLLHCGSLPCQWCTSCLCGHLCVMWVHSKDITPIRSVIVIGALVLLTWRNESRRKWAFHSCNVRLTLKNDCSRFSFFPSCVYWRSFWPGWLAGLVTVYSLSGNPGTLCPCYLGVNYPYIPAIWVLHFQLWE